MRHNHARRRSIRLPHWDYRLPGPYAITLCTRNRIHRFGAVLDGVMTCNDVGHMVQAVWLDMVREFPAVTLDAFVVMPNHLHAILLLDSEDITRNPTLGTVVQRFKSITTTRYINGIREQGWDRFDDRLWQRNYYEHIIRDERDLARCRTYIDANPANWITDRDNVP